MDTRAGTQSFPARSLTATAMAALLSLAVTGPVLADSTGELPEPPGGATGSFIVPEPPQGWCETQPECYIDGVSDRVSHTATLLPDGRVLLIGGSIGEVREAETWDRGEWAFADTEWEPIGTSAVQVSPAGAMVEDVRLNHTATLLSDGRVLVTGGGYLSEWGDLALASAEIWDPATETFSPLGEMAQERMWHTATLLADDRVLVVGGRDIEGALASAEVWDPATETFSPVGEMAQQRMWHTATLLADDRVLILGGRNDTDVLGSAEVWDPVTGDFGAAPALTEARAGHTASTLSDERILVVGGVGNGGDDEAAGRPAVASAEIWDPVSSGFVVDDTGPLDLPRAFHTATNIGDGRVIIIGGLANVPGGQMESPVMWDGMMGWEYATAESWDPATGTFSPAGTLDGPRFRHTSTPLPDGRVIVLGGGLAQPQIWVRSETR